MKSLIIIVTLLFLGIIAIMLYDAVFNQDPLSIALLIMFAAIIGLGWVLSKINKSNPNSKIGKILQKIKEFIEGGLP